MRSSVPIEVARIHFTSDYRVRFEYDGQVCYTTKSSESPPQDSELFLKIWTAADSDSAGKTLFKYLKIKKNCRPALRVGDATPEEGTGAPGDATCTEESLASYATAMPSGFTNHVETGDLSASDTHTYTLANGYSAAFTGSNQPPRDPTTKEQVLAEGR